ncbi:MAG: prepilin-type N-terminal cleavage/methylation domain-containing protein [Planctomycetes bacterium]|nr:prepilin-type N-terminal cleavage/methylation domain-containing protein [Planctomycetota bacterium]
MILSPFQKAPRQAGITLVEVTVALGIFSVLILSVGITLLRGMEHRRQAFLEYRGMESMRNLIAEIQETANLPQDLPALRGIGAVYMKYHDKTFAVPELPSGQIQVACAPNEAAVPAVLGGPQDLNFDGDAGDNLGNLSNGTDLRLVPMVLTLTFVEDGKTRTQTVHRLITQTTD